MNRILITTFLLLLALGVVGALGIIDVHAQQSYSSCMDLLTTAAANAGVEGEVRNFEDLINADGTHSCLVEYVVSSHGDETTVFLSLNETNITPESSCTYVPLEQFQETTFHGYAARTFYRKNPNGKGETFETKALGWCMHKGGRNYYFEVSTSSGSVDQLGPARDPVPIADQLWSLAEDGLPLTPETLEDSGSVTGGIEETELPATGLEVPQVQPGQAEADQEQPEVSKVGLSTFDEAWNSKSAKAIRHPLIPALGGLIGSGLAWLLAKGTEQGSQFLGGSSSVNTLEMQPYPPETVFSQQAAPPQPPVESPPPPIAQSEPPPITTPDQASPWTLGFNAIKDSVGGASTAVDLFKDYFTIADPPEVLESIRKAVKAWHDAPSASTAADYLTAIRNSNAIKVENLGNNLKSASKGLDAIDAAVKAYNICQERGYTGWDAVLTTGAEYGKKFVVNTITSNPVVGLVDTVAGNSTQLLFGAENRIDVAAIVDKSAEAWDKVTQEAAQIYNSGYQESADNYRAETLQGLTNKMKQLVSDGKISKPEGIKRLKKAIDIFNKETPKI